MIRDFPEIPVITLQLVLILNYTLSMEILIWIAIRISIMCVYLYVR